MREKGTGFWLGTLLIVAGVVVLLRELIVWEWQEEYLWGTAFLVIALALFLSHRQQPRRGLPLLAWLAVAFSATLYCGGIGGVAEDVRGAVFLLFTAIGFFSLHTREPGQWWGALVGGTVFVLAVISGTTSLDLLDPDYTGFVFFFGVSLAFLYLYLIRTPENRLNWAKYPAAASFLVALLVLATETSYEFHRYFWPALLIASGVALILRDVLTRPHSGDQAGPPPARAVREASSPAGSDTRAAGGGAADQQPSRA